MLLISSAFILSGCGAKNREQTQTQTQAQTQNQDQTQAKKQDGMMEQKRDGSGDGQGRMINPPTEMIEVCSGKMEGDSCEATMPARNTETEDQERTITGTCKKIGESEVLSCAPENMPQGGMRN